MTKLLRIIFFGTSIFAAHHLNALANSSHKILAVFTQEKYINKRKKNYIYEVAKKYNLLLFQSHLLTNSNIIYIIKNFHANLIIVTSYGIILPKEILNLPKFGCINIHGSLLPRWRGPAPIQRAIEFGDTKTGISIIKMDTGIDTGNILYTATCEILPEDTSKILCYKLAQIGSQGLLYTIDKLLFEKTLLSQPQKNKNLTTYAHKLHKKDGKINWKLSAAQIERKIRAFNPWPTSFFQIKKQKIKVWNSKIENDNNFYNHKNQNTNLVPGTILEINSSGIKVLTGSGILILTELQIPGKNKIYAHDIFNAYKKLFTPYSILE